MAFKFLGPDRTEDQLKRVLDALGAGKAPSEVELRNIDVKEEPGRRSPDGAVLAGTRKNEKAASYLANELACLANTPGAGIIILGISDRGERIGTALDPEWLRHRIYELTDKRLTIDIREGGLDGCRLLLLGAPEAVEPIRMKGRIRWRVADHCVDVDAASWAAGRLQRSGYDWSAQPSGHSVRDVSASALEFARRFLEQATNDQGAADLARATDDDLLRRLNVVDDNGLLTNGGALLFVSTPEPAIDYVRRDYPGGDSTLRVTRPGPLLMQLAEAESTAMASNRTVHQAAGLVQGQVRALPPLAVRESIVNGVVHRDWLSPAPTVVEHVGDTLVVTSPGGFVAGISPSNIITHPSTPRYRSLANVMSQLRLAEREGIGVDRMVAEMLAFGHAPPDIREIDGPYVRVALLGGSPDKEWMEFLSSCVPDTVVRDVDMLLLLSHLLSRGWLDIARAAPVLQRSEAETNAAVLRLIAVHSDGEPVILSVAGVPVGEPPAWRISNPVRARLPSRVQPMLDGGGRQRLILDWARSRGRVSSTEAADLVGVTNGYAGRLLAGLEEEGLLEPSRTNRRGRGFYYRPKSQ